MNIDNYRNKMLFCLEGLDGCGKHTQAVMVSEKLRELLKPQNIEVYHVEFPAYDSPTGKLVKAYLDGELGGIDAMSPFAASVPYGLDRYFSFINSDWGNAFRDPNKKCIFIFDRYTQSNVIYQTAKLPEKDQKGRNELKAQIENFEYGMLGIPQECVNFYLQLPEDVTIRNVKARHNKIGRNIDIHESNFEYLHSCHDVLEQAVAHSKKVDLVHEETGIHSEPSATKTIHEFAADNSWAKFILRLELIEQQLFDLPGFGRWTSLSCWNDKRSEMIDPNEICRKIVTKIIGYTEFIEVHQLPDDFIQSTLNDPM